MIQKSWYLVHVGTFSCELLSFDDEDYDGIDANDQKIRLTTVA